MKFRENRAAGWGVREYHNVELPPDGPRPGHIDPGGSTKVVQRGTKETTGRLWDVTVYYQVGRKRRVYHGAEANRILRTVQENRSDRQQPLFAVVT